MKTLRLSWLILFTLALDPGLRLLAQGTAFTYHGKLSDNGGPANGSYDLIFTIFDAANAGLPVGGTLTNSSTGVTNGLFTARLNFGGGIFTGPERWLEIGVCTNGAGDFTALSPRQLLTPTPYAIMANTASNLLGSLPADQLSGPLTDAQLPLNIPRLDGNATFTGIVGFDNPANTFNGHFIGDGSQLTGLNPTNLAPGTAVIDIAGHAATASSATTAGIANTADNFSGVLAGEVTGPQEATVVASVGGQSAANVAGGVSAANAATPANTPETIVRRDGAGNFTAGAITAASVTGDGSGLTALDAGQLASGTVADARLSGNVALRDAHQSFSGTNTFAACSTLRTRTTPLSAASAAMAPD